MNTLAKIWQLDEELGVWAKSQTNTALRDNAAVRLAQGLLHKAGLPTHPDQPKNWDTFLALYHALADVEPSEAILDAGAERYSAFLPALSRSGYTNLTAVNLSFGAEEEVNGITFRHGDITRSGLASGSYAFISCLSVIEHGVDVEAFLKECERLLCPGGRVFLSFDYWEQPIDTRGQEAYGAPIQVFTRNDIDKILRWAEEVGLLIEGTPDFRCQDRVVHWQRFDLHYTFANLLLRRGSDPVRSAS